MNNPLKVRLPDIANILPGYQFRKGVKDEVETGKPVGVIQVRDIEDGVLKIPGLEHVRMRRPEAYLVKQGDVLLLTRGHRFTAVPITEALENTIANHLFLILRVHDPSTVMPEFLAWQLNHPQTQELFKGVARQTHIPFVSRADVESFLLVVPPLSSQKQIIELEELKKREAMLSEQLTQKRAQFMDALTMQLATGRIIVPEKRNPGIIHAQNDETKVMGTRSIKRPKRRIRLKDDK